MSFKISLAVFLAFALGAAQAEAASCSTFVSIKSFDADAMEVEVNYEKGNQRKFFPQPEGAPPISKIPKKCKRRVTRESKFPVKATGGRMSVTQVRANFGGQMLNDTDDAAWFTTRMEGLIEGETTVVILLRPGPGKKDPVKLTTIYLPITEEELAEIKRLEDQAEDT